MTHQRIYIAGPMTLGDTAVNVRRGIDAAEQILTLGACPYVPHLTHFWHLLHAHSHAEWMALDFCWLQVCEALLRLPGASVGADMEEAEARRLGLPVFRSVEEVETWLMTHGR